jgi:dTDP-4-amino-4,6-dideoxygalactose transaminase
MINFLYKIKNKIYFPLRLLLKVTFIILKKNYSKYPKYVLNFEEQLGKKFNSKYSLTFSSGSAACMSSILSLGQKKNSLAFVSKLSFPSTIISLLNSNYTIKYLDFDLNFNPIFPTSDNNTTPDLIIITHVFGFPVGFKELELIKAKYKGVKIIFDCSHSQGAKINGKHLCEYADLTFISLQGSKAISGGEGGVVLTNDEIYYNRMVKLSHPGRANSKIENKYAGISMSLKLRMHPLAAVIAESTLKTLDKHNFIINKKFNIIYNILSKTNSIKIPNIENLNLGGFHYGLPFYSERKLNDNIFFPIKSYNWPLYEVNDFYKTENFYLSNFFEQEKKYSEFINNTIKVDDLRSKLFFIDLDWIKSNSEKYISKSINNFLMSIKEPKFYVD